MDPIKQLIDAERNAAALVDAATRRRMYMRRRIQDEITKAIAQLHIDLENELEARGQQLNEEYHVRVMMARRDYDQQLAKLNRQIEMNREAVVQMLIDCVSA